MSRGKWEPEITEEEAAFVLGRLFVRQRIELGISQAEVARRTGMARPNISRLERGRGPHCPLVWTVLRMAAALELEPSVLFSVLDSRHGDAELPMGTASEDGRR